jgi:outer membrane protein OmpA-like peptidoglycan-associated protein
MAAKIVVLGGKAPLNDDELDAVLAAADEELLGYVRAAADPEAALLKIMAAGDENSVSSETSGMLWPPAYSGTSRRGCRRMMVILARITVAAVIIFAAWCSLPRAVPREGEAHGPETAVSREATISFAPNRYDITATARTQLSVLLEPLKVWRALYVTISAYTNGYSASGQVLADERADAIRDWLTTAAGVSPGKLHATTLVVPHRDGRPHGLATVSIVLDGLKSGRIGASGPP